MIRQPSEPRKWPTRFAVPWLDIISGRDSRVSASLARFGLLLASQPYRWVVCLRNYAYDRGWLTIYPAPLPVISVGNLTVGGTGKTPTVVMLARWFRQRQIRVAILSRGYGAGADGRNDEAREMEVKLPDVPHLQHPDRLASAQTACQELSMQLLLLDDGFQHRRLSRQLEIVLLDATNPFGFESHLPRGLLRESPRSLRRAQVVMLTRCDLVPPAEVVAIRTRVLELSPNASWVETEHAPSQLRNAAGQTRSVDDLRGKRVFIFSAIGNPAAFAATVRRCGCTLVGEIAYDDHHRYSAQDLVQIERRIAQLASVDWIVCTGKDLAKLEITNLGGKPLWMLDIDLRIRHGEAGLEEELSRILAALPTTNDSFQPPA
jgi:tetraacyldisaccharide 4'-kinase